MVDRDAALSTTSSAGEQIEPIRVDATELVEQLRQVGVEVRLMGGLGIAVRSPSADHPVLARPHDDVDLVTSRRSAQLMHAAMKDLAFAGDEEFNALQGSRRLIFYSDARPAAKVDVFIERVEMCHTFDLSQRLAVDAFTLSLADLLLLKLQVVELNEKDVKDIAALLLDHPVSSDEAGINADYIAGLCGNDWGLWRTITGNLERLRGDIGQLVEPVKRGHIEEQFGRLTEAINAAPRSRRWRLRSKIGDRVQWYELPEEVDR